MVDKILERINDGLFHNLDSRPPYDRIHFERYPKIIHTTCRETALEGDFCKTYKMSGEKFGFVVGDVPGHKNDPGVTMSSIYMKLVFDKVVNNNIDRPNAYNIMNDANKLILNLPKLFPDGFYPTVFSVYDLNTRELEIVKAGHPSPIRVNVKLASTVGGRPQTALGLLKEKYQSTKIKLDIGDRYYVFTDGLHEAGASKSKEKIEWINKAEKELCKHLHNTRNMEIYQSLEEIVKKVKEENRIDYFEDDVTIAAFAVLK